MKKILIVEDDEFYRKIYKKKFELAQYEVETAVNGEEGLSKMKSFKPDLVFMDLMMPKIDGFTTIEQAKADDELKDIPIVVLTNLSTSDDAEKVKGKGAIDVIVKSNVEPQAVVEKAKELLGE
jgi:CheY-like chemotaxis protein